MNKPVSEDIKVEYNNLVKNVEKLRNDVNDLDNYVNTMNEKSVSSETIVTEPTTEPTTETPIVTTSVTETPIVTTPEPTQPINPPAQPVPKEIIKEKEDKKEDLLEALTDTNEQQTKTDEQLLQEQKDEMNARKTNIEQALIKMAKNIKNGDIFTSKIEAWNLLNKTNLKLEQYLSTTLFYDIKRDWVTYGQQLWFRPKYYLDELKKSYHELNKNLGRNEYFKDIMPKYIKKDVNNPIDVSDHIFINIKTQLDDTYNGIIQMEKKGGRKTKKQRKQKKQRKSKRKQRKSHRIK
jgi:hypothetical protein